MKQKSLVITIAIMLLAMYSFAQLRDIDGNTYKTISLGLQEWMTENLNVGHFRNGDIIPEVRTDEEWRKALAEHKPVYCYYNDFSGYGRTYGKLYNWYAVNDSRGLAPDGWRVPTDFQWTALVAQLGGNTVAGSKMKSRWGWNDNGNGTNESDLTFLPGGHRNIDGTFSGVEGEGCWWSSTESNTKDAWTFSLNSFDGSSSRNSSFKGLGFSVRCFKN